MPITLTNPVPPVLGPGLTLGGQSSLIGPIPIDWHWQIGIGRRGEERPSYIITGPIASPLDHQFFFTIGGNTAGWTTTPQGTIGLQTGADASVTVELVDSVGTVHDSGTNTSYVWDSTTNLWTLVQQGQSGGFSSDDRALLTSTERHAQVLGEPTDLTWTTASGQVIATLAQIFSRSTLDRLTLTEVTSGPTCDPVRFNVDLWFHTVVVRVTTIGEDLVPKTPDENWYFPDLAVLRVFRGADLEYRRGIHTPTFMAEKPWQWGWWFDSRSPLYGVPPELTIAVDWRLGCCGQVFLMSLP